MEVPQGAEPQVNHPVTTQAVVQLLEVIHKVTKID